VAPPIAAGRAVTIEGNQAHYLNKVMRVAAGGSVILCDDVSGEWAATVSDVGKRQVTLIPQHLLREREAVPDFWLCPALLKKDRFDLVLEKATELGVGEIRPMVTRRCVATSLNTERARAIVTEAAEQCARTALPALAEPAPLTKMLLDWPQDRTLYFADELGGEPASEAFAPTIKAALFTGPEGGFDQTERDAIRGHPLARPISLGPRILRGETAAIAATALWMGIAGDWHNSLARE
jgi:16S rRNA (uracil1498-N3)-methyltransferase